MCDKDRDPPFKPSPFKTSPFKYFPSGIPRRARARRTFAGIRLNCGEFDGLMAQDNRELRPEICVIGAGPGGLSVAAAAATFDFSSVLIEKGRMGGESLNRGSVPAQALIAAAERANAVRTGARFGLKIGRFAVDFGAVNAYMREVV